VTSHDVTTAVAAVDCGSGATRLLVMRVDGLELCREEVVTNLSAGMGPHDELSAEAIERTICVLREFRERGLELGVTTIRAVTTAAARRATNTAAFLDAAEVALGVRPEVLTPDEEGRLAFAGATRNLPVQHNEWNEAIPDLVVDIGGGSTEFVVGLPGTDPVGVCSIDTGCVRLWEEYLSENDPPGPLALSQAISVLHAHFEDVEIAIPSVKHVGRVIGIGGSIQTVAMVELGATADVNGFRLSRAAAEDVYRTLVMERRADRAHNPGLSADRVDSILGGAAILVAILRHFQLDELRVSRADLLDGVVHSLRSAHQG
jgi:exopolyphosphatase / guanosine-5'-triphosphate,3'-diphosphate pyrophosphatase